MRSFTYTRPATVREAIAAHVEAGEGARYIAGGTTLYDLMKLGVEAPAHLVDVSAIEGLGSIETGGETLRFGAMALMADVAADPGLRERAPILSEALRKAASQQLRNMATVGGALLQRTRCMYFRNGDRGLYPCNKRAPGAGCAALGGLDRGQALLGWSEACSAVSPGDWPVALVALDASVEVEGPAGRRVLPIADLYRLPEETPHLEFALHPAEIITAITAPATAASRRSTYHKLRDRESYAFALVSAGVALEMEGDVVREARIALGGVATTPWRAHGAEASLAGAVLTRERALEAGREAFVGARPGRRNAFKIPLGADVVADALMIAAGRTP